MTLPIIHGEFRLGADPDLRYTPSGKAVCNFRAVASSRKQVDGEWRDDKQVWLTFDVWGTEAENVSETLQKGDLVLVQGKLYIDEYDTREGEKRQQPKVMVDHVGPALKFATAKVTRTTRTGGSSGGQSGSSSSGGEDPWASPPQGDEPPF